ncbi:hypothetical protein GCM10028861_22800 [Flavobacterium koreense]
MINIILILTTIISIVGLFLSIQTIVETRNKYYNEYLERKRKFITDKNKSKGYLVEKENNINQDNSKTNKK